jgi:hypothetical protein
MPFSSLRTAVLAVGVSAAPAVALAEGAEGLWYAPGVTSCAGQGDDVAMAITRSGVDWYESSCSFGGDAPAGFLAVRGAMACTGEGETWRSNLAIAAQGDTLRLTHDGHTSVYRRCGGGTPSAAVSTGAVLGVTGDYDDLRD